MRGEPIDLPKGPKADFEWFLTDGDIARLLRCSISTVRRLATKGPGERGGIDLRKIDPVHVGEMRRWPLSNVCAFFKMTEEAVLACLRSPRHDAA